MIRIHENQANSTSKTNPAPSSHEPQKQCGIREIDEILPTLNTPRDSVYFASKNEFYTVGMRLFIKCPYSDGLGSVRGIVEILMPLYLEGKETLK